MIIPEHKLRKRVVFSLDMETFRMDFYLQYHRRVKPNTHFVVECRCAKFGLQRFSLITGALNPCIAFILGRIALIFQNCFTFTTFFRNFANTKPNKNKK